MKKSRGSQSISQKEITNDVYHVMVNTIQTGYESDGKQWGWTETWNRKELKPYAFSSEMFKKNNIFFSYPDTVECAKGLLKGETSAWLVWAVYSTGSTFGRDHNGSHALLGLFNLKDYKAAQDFSEYIWAVREIGSKKYTALDGQVIEVYPSWAGYFERLEEVHI